MQSDVFATRLKDAAARALSLNTHKNAKVSKKRAPDVHVVGMGSVELLRYQTQVSFGAAVPYKPTF